jgi:hypothetical protein
LEERLDHGIMPPFGAERDVGILMDRLPRRPGISSIAPGARIAAAGSEVIASKKMRS